MTDRVFLRIGDRGAERVAIADPGGGEIGFAECKVTDRRLEVQWIELAVEHRRWGLGAEAVRLLEAEAAQRWDVKEVRAHVPREVGLALYFWLRLGYRPAGVEGGGEGDNSVMVLVRELEEMAA